MSIASEPLFQWLSNYAYEPTTVYLAIFLLMFASGFGFPLPEEVTIISVGLLAYMGAHPELFPPPTDTASVVNGYEAAAFTAIAVFSADMLVFFIGRTAGRKIVRSTLFQKVFPADVMKRVDNFLHKYGSFAAFLFRFTPGLRFPAHIFLGMSPFSKWKFALIDGLAVLISVPTQIILVYKFGEPILAMISKMKSILLVVIALVVVYWLVKKAMTIWGTKGQTTGS